jgi:hypothetical protein
LEFKSAQPVELPVASPKLKIQEVVSASGNPGSSGNSSVSGGSSVFASLPRSIADMGYAPICPTCGGMLRMEESCMKCMECGYSKCG